MVVVTPSCPPVIPEADHFFSGHLEQLVAAVDRYLDQALQPAAQTAVAGAR